MTSRLQNTTTEGMVGKMSDKGRNEKTGTVHETYGLVDGGIAAQCGADAWKNGNATLVKTDSAATCKRCIKITERREAERKAMAFDPALLRRAMGAPEASAPVGDAAEAEPHTVVAVGTEDRKVGDKKAYLAWADTLDESGAALLGMCEKLVSSTLGMDAPKGLKEWRLFVTTVVAEYERAAAMIERAERAEEVAQRTVVMVGRDGASKPIYRYRDELGLPEWQQSQISAADRALAEAPVSVAQAVTGALLAGAQSWIDATELEQREAEPLTDAEFLAEVEPTRVIKERMLSLILATVEPYSGALHTGAVTIPELVALDVTRHMISQAKHRGWIRHYGWANEGTHVVGLYLTSEGIAERDRRQGPVFSESDPSTWSKRPAGYEWRDVSEVESHLFAPDGRDVSAEQCLAAERRRGAVDASTMEGQPSTAVVTMTKPSAVVACRPRVANFRRFKASCARKGWK